jgi:hypothetical protein
MARIFRVHRATASRVASDTRRNPVSATSSVSRNAQVGAQPLARCEAFGEIPALGVKLEFSQFGSAIYNGLVGYLPYISYSAQLGFEIGAHALRATAATNALDNQADIAKVQEWLGHANIATTRIYDHRKTRPEDSPTFKVNY